MNVVVAEWWWVEVGEGGGVSMKGWSRWVSCVDKRVSCVDSSVGVLSGQTPRSDDAGGRGLVMWG